jgi:hypothetical protein
MRALAIKKSSSETTTGFQEMGTLRCDGCGEEFFIGWVAGKQAAWLERVFEPIELADWHLEQELFDLKIKQY